MMRVNVPLGKGLNKEPHYNINEQPRNKSNNSLWYFSAVSVAISKCTKRNYHWLYIASAA